MEAHQTNPHTEFIVSYTTINCSNGATMAIPHVAVSSHTPFSEYYDAYRRGYTAGEVDSLLDNPEGNGLTCFGSSDYVINLDAWEEAQRFGYQDGLEGNDMMPERSLLCWLDSNFSI